ncbi:MAG: cellulase family glycosylhydrolase [Chthoniobacteraceae bacterium]|nr:cellulase family glycosylhydrolase [Chthoniobacteraceae bacterium]
MYSVRSLLIFLAFTVAAAFPLRCEAGAPAAGFRVQGRLLTGPGGKEVRLRGFNVCWWVPPTRQDALGIKAMGANSVRYMFGYHPAGTFAPDQLDCIWKQVPLFTDAGLWVIPVVHDFRRDGQGPYDSPELEREFLEMWTEIIARLKDNPRVIAWEPINEPHDTTDEKVAAWYARVIAHIRKLDPRRPIVVEGNGYSWPKNLVDSLKMEDPNILYAFHWYGPFEYTHRQLTPPAVYPGPWGRDWMAQQIDPAVRFREKYNVPVWCGEWGVMTACEGHPQWLADTAAVLEERQFPWSHWAWANKPGNSDDGSFDINPQKPEIYGVLQRIFLQYNISKPSPSPHP